MSKNHQRKSNRLPDHIMIAASNNELETIADWLTKENLNYKDIDNRTILFHAVIGGATNVVPFILNIGPDIDIKDKKGWSPIHYAVQNYYPSIVEILLNAGADIEIKDYYGNTPLWRAVFASQGKGEVIKLLISKGANPNNENESGVSPFGLAKKIANYDIAQFF
jgi:ankyrin repeat protein